MLQDINIKFLKGVGQKRAEQFSKLGVSSVGALLHFYPRNYEDWGHIVQIFGAENCEKCCVKATVSASITRRRSQSGITVFETSAYDETGSVHIIIFNNKYAAAKLQMGKELLFFGTVVIHNGARQMLSPSISEVGTNARIRPIYRTVKNMSSTYIETCVQNALNMYLDILEDPIPEQIRAEYNLMMLKDAIREIHFPTTMESMLRARERFIFEELLCLRLGMKQRQCKIETKVKIEKDYIGEFLKTLPFTPTSAQLRAINSALDDMSSGYLMNRLLQGDVGSGKTMVAAALCYTMHKNGYQSAIMVPTEILAAQHYSTMKKFFEGTDINVVLLCGNMSVQKRREALQCLSSGNATVAVGTHALISEGVEFKNLGLVITDEQHRFGVRQRGALAKKGLGTHVLVMSATPIPRTLALAVYGDLDVTVIDELPKGRIPIETYRINSSIRERAYNYIKKHLDEGRQGYIVCPLVEEGEMTDLVSATQYYEDIKKSAFKDYRVGLLHGQMSTKDKNQVMQDFLLGEIQLLVSTVVIEVGVDVPNAVIMLIENAERFGLSQLHQLRGRIGRGTYKSTCILLSDSQGKVNNERLKVMCETNDGFLVSERDLNLRGPGDFLGSRQHGLPDLQIADMLTNMDVLENAGAAADKINLESPENVLLKQAVVDMFGRLEATC